MDNVIHCIYHYGPLDNVFGFPNTYPPDSDLSGGYTESLGSQTKLLGFFMEIYGEFDKTVIVPKTGSCFCDVFFLLPAV